MFKVAHSKPRLIILCLLSLFCSGNAIASEPHNIAPSLTSQAPTISRVQAVEIAKQGYDSKVLKVVKKKTSSGVLYKVKLLTKSGHVKQVSVDASNGQIQSK